MAAVSAQARQYLFPQIRVPKPPGGDWKQVDALRRELTAIHDCPNARNFLAPPNVGTKSETKTFTTFPKFHLGRSEEEFFES